jgi:hypothetical protein
MALFHLLRNLALSLSPRRAHRRVPRALPVDWHLFGSKVHHLSTTLDLSSGGAMLHAVAPLPVGAPLVLAVSTTDGPLEVHARVAWSAEPAMGVRFTRPLAASSG